MFDSWWEQVENLVEDQIVCNLKHLKTDKTEIPKI